MRVNSPNGPSPLPPLYPAPPYSYTNAELYTLRFPVDPESVRALLPEPLEVPTHASSAELTGTLTLARYPDSTIGPYDEVYWLLPAQFGEEIGLYCPLMYLTSDAGLAAGREIWGFPKKLAAITWTDMQDRKQVVLSRNGETLCEIRVQCTETYPVHGENATPKPAPIFNMRRTPAPGPGFLGETHLTATFPRLTIQSAAIGIANVRMEGSEDDPVQRLAPPDRRVPLRYTCADITLPAAGIAHRID